MHRFGSDLRCATLHHRGSRPPAVGNPGDRRPQPRATACNVCPGYCTRPLALFIRLRHHMPMRGLSWRGRCTSSRWCLKHPCCYCSRSRSRRPPLNRRGAPAPKKANTLGSNGCTSRPERVQDQQPRHSLTPKKITHASNKSLMFLIHVLKRSISYEKWSERTIFQ